MPWGPADGRTKAGSGRSGARRASPRRSPRGCWHAGPGTPWEEAEEGAPGFVRPQSVQKQDGGCHRGRPPRVSGCGARTGLQAASHSRSAKT